MLSIGDFLTKAAHHQSDRPSLTFEGRTFTWRETEERCWGIAATFYRLGVRPGDHVAFLGFNCHQYFECYFAPSRIGAALVPINFRLSLDEIIECVNDSRPTVLVIDRHHVDEARAIFEACSSVKSIIFADNGSTPTPENMTSYESSLDADRSDINFEGLASRDNDTLVIFYTGGTTGKPKGVMLSHINNFSNAIGAILSNGLIEGETNLLSGPMFHAGVGAKVFIATLMGSHSVLLPKFDVLDFMRAVSEYKINVVQLFPTMMTMVLDHPQFEDFDISSIRLVGYGASPMTSALLKRAMKAFSQATFYNGFGMTEAGPVLTVLGPESHVLEGPKAGKLQSIGQPVSHVDVRVFDQNDQPVPTGQAGEIVARGPNMMKGYWNQPELTAETMRGGWYHTGDAGYFDEDGFLYLTGRIKDMIVSGGENVYPIETENVLSQHPAVSECAVIGIPDDFWGESVYAVVALRSNNSVCESDLIKFCRDRLAHYKCPCGVTIRTEPMPLTSVGKIDKVELRKPFWEDAGV